MSLRAIGIPCNKPTGFPDFTPYSKAQVKIMGLTGNPRIDNKLANQAAGFGNSTNAPQENLLGDDLHFTVLLRSDLKKGSPEQRGTGTFLPLPNTSPGERCLGSYFSLFFSCFISCRQDWTDSQATRRNHASSSAVTADFSGGVNFNASGLSP